MTDQVTERVAVVAKIQPGSRDQAAQIIAEGAPYDLGAAGFRRHTVFLAERLWSLFSRARTSRACPRARRRPHSLSFFSVWGPLLEGTPALAREEFYWEAD